MPSSTCEKSGPVTGTQRCELKSKEGTAVRQLGGVLVAAKVADVRPPMGDPLVAGDIIHYLNGSLVQDVASLRSKLESLGSSAPIVLQVERSGTLHFVAIEGD